MRQEDFVSVMREVVPQLLDDLPRGFKRDLSPDPSTPQQITSKTVRSDDVDESLIAELAEYETLFALWDQQDEPIESLIATYLAKRQQKEIHHTGNETALQEQVDDARVIEWKTLSEKGAVRVHGGNAARKLRHKHPNRFMQSRFVINHKSEDAGETSRVKARWCLKGHLDPDLMAKVHPGKCHSPTMSQLGRALLFQLTASFKWN